MKAHGMTVNKDKRKAMVVSHLTRKGTDKDGEFFEQGVPE